MHQALYRKWRPLSFDEVYGQEHITSVLKHQVSSDRVSHAYLFSGSRGTGKTTCAKILARALNCLEPIGGSPCGNCDSCRISGGSKAVDIIEMDAASNTGVEYIRDIREEVVYTPSALKKRVYIIDEVHMLSISAFNALLKTLEEPPPHIVFILATTEPHKIPSTVLSRCQRFEFKRIHPRIMIDRLAEISNSEGYKFTDDAGLLIARISQGSMRDAISLLELCAAKAGGEVITIETVSLTAGVEDRGKLVSTVSAIISRNYSVVFETIDNIISSSRDIGVFWQDLIDYYRDMLVVKYTENPEDYLDLTTQELADLKKNAEGFTREKLLHHSQLLSEVSGIIQRGTSSKRAVAELALLRMCDPALDTSKEALLARIAALEEKTTFETGQDVSSNTNNIRLEEEPAVKTSSTNRISEGIPKENKPSDNIENIDTGGAEALPDTDSVENKETVADEQKTLLSEISCWIEVIGKLSKHDPMTAAFFRDSRAYRSNDQKIYVDITNCFMPAMVEKPEIINFIAKTLASLEEKDRPYQSGDIIFRFCKCSDNNSGDDYIDEIIE